MKGILAQRKAASPVLRFAICDLRSAAAGRLAGRAAAVLLLGLLVFHASGAGAQESARRKTVAIQVLPATEQDNELAVQVTKISLDTLENQRNMVTRRYLADKDVRAAEDLAKSITEATRKVSTAARSTVFDQGNEEIQGAYLLSKELLGELDVKLVADLYLGLAMAKAVLGESGLAGQYMAIFRNLVPDRSRQSVGYAKLFLDLFDSVEKQRAVGKKRVMVTTEPPGVLVGIDGGTWGKSPLQVDLAPGGHLVQVEEEGYYRSGFLKDPKLDGDKWRITLRPIESRNRFLETRSRLLAHYFPPPPPPPGKKKGPPPPEPLSADTAEMLLRSVTELLSADCLLFLGVTSEGDSMRLRGAFVSTFGVFAVDSLVPRDLKVIE
ncbi:MAG: PEGA domain-containing protein, partial [Deltaproteobacteria bacterium]|nr:PEGA domain-containing protein [Deltaproteobacteria bacterium]